jgi:hypothetical protein
MRVINLNALLRRRVEYYEYPWAIEGYLRSVQSQLRSLFQAVVYASRPNSVKGTPAV